MVLTERNRVAAKLVSNVKYVESDCTPSVMIVYYGLTENERRTTILKLLHLI
jgi:hypothetical protein